MLTSNSLPGHNGGIVSPYYRVLMESHGAEILIPRLGLGYFGSGAPLCQALPSQVIAKETRLAKGKQRANRFRQLGQAAAVISRTKVQLALFHEGASPNADLPRLCGVPRRPY